MKPVTAFTQGIAESKFLRLILIGMLMLVCVHACYTQDIAKIALLRNQITTAKGQERFELLNKLSWEYRSAFPDSAIVYGQEALTLGRSLGLNRGLATTLNYIGLANYYKGNLVRAYEFYDKASKEAARKRDSLELAYSRNNIGRLFSEQGMLTQSYPYFVEAESIFKALRDSSGLAYVYQSFAMLYKMEKNFIKSEQYYRQALEIRQQLGITRDMISAMVLLGKLYMDIKRFDDALLYLQRADSAGVVIQDALAQAEIKILIAEYYLGKKETERANTLCLEGLSYILAFKNVKLLPRAYLIMGEINFEEKRYPAARKFFTIALGIAERMKYLDLSMRAHYFLWKDAEINHNQEAALEHSNDYLVLKDSINDIHISERVAKFQFQLEIERKQQENELLRVNQARNEAIIREQNLQRAGLAILTVFLLILFYFQWRHSKKKKQANIILSQQNVRIEEMNVNLSNLVAETTQRNTTLQNHVTTLLEFSKSKVVNFGTTLAAVQDIARLTAHSLGVSRISVWTFHKQSRTIESVACYDLSSGRFLDPVTLDLSNFPHYEEALTTKRVIEASDARNSRETKEFTDSYLVPLDIYSMLDVTFSMDGELSGLICCEQQHAPRVWKSEDIIFTSSVADITSLAYRGAQRREYEKRLKQQRNEIALMNEVLELRVKERTEELQNRNNQLTEYAFINSHLLRSPVSKILGLINLMEMDKGGDPREVMNHLKRSCDDLDTIVKQITIALDNGEHFDRKVIKPK
jgi:tetratricopeptide (TPR) repeat protein